MKFKVLVTKVEGFFIPDLSNPEINKFELFVPRMSAKEEREYISSCVGTEDYKVSSRKKARFPLELDVIGAIENSVAEIADFFKEHDDEVIEDEDEE